MDELESKSQTPNTCMLSEQEKNELERNKWKSRRKMAWIALYSMIITTIIVLFMPIQESKLSIISEVLVWFYFAMASVIGAYMGVTAWAARR